MITALPSSIFMRTLRFCKCIKCLLYPSCHCMPSLPHRGHSLIIHHVTSLIQILHCLSVNQFVKPSAHFSSCNILPHSNILTSAKAPNINVLIGDALSDRISHNTCVLGTTSSQLQYVQPNTDSESVSPLELSQELPKNYLFHCVVVSLTWGGGGGKEHPKLS